MGIEAVRHDCVGAIWDDVSPILQRAINASQGDFSTDDIKEFILSRDMQLWVWRDDGRITACCVTQILNYPRRRVCQIPYVAGHSMKKWISCEPLIAEWAKTQGCTQLEGFCRDGWLRILQPYQWRKVWTTTRKDI